MTEDARPRVRTSCVLPSVVVGLFVLVAAVDLTMVVVAARSSEFDTVPEVEVVFAPVREGSAAAESPVEQPVGDGSDIASPDGRSMVRRDGDRMTVLAPGELVFRFSSPHAGSTLEIDYRFRDPDGRGRCEVTVGRVASRFGVDVVRRARLAAAKRSRGTFRHDLADHVGGFEVRIRVNRAAAKRGFEVGVPRVVRG